MSEVAQPAWLDISLEKLSVATGLAATIAFAASAVFEFGFLSGTGLGYSRIPISLTDISKGILTWLPLTVVTFLNLLISPMIKAEQNAKAFTIVRLSYVIGILTYILLGDRFLNVLYFSLSLMAIDMLGAVLRNGIHKDKLTPTHKQIVLSSLSMLAFLFLAGFNLARSEPAKDDRDLLILSDGKSIEGHILRTYEAGYLIRDDGLTFVYASQIRSIRYRGVAFRKVGVPCYYWSLWCPSKT